MSIRRWVATAAVAIFGIGVVAVPVIAHHSSTPFYDPDTRVEIQGAVTRFVFRNPHAFLYLDVTDESGATSEWQVELGAPVGLRRIGWTPDTLTTGTVVKVNGRRSRAEGSQGVCCVRMTRADDSPIVQGGRTEERDAR